MTQNQRLGLACAIVLVDFLVVAIPVAALILGYAILARPPWFREWVDRLYSRD